MNLYKKIMYIFLLNIMLISNIIADDTMKVLILNSWSPDHVWTQGEDRGIKDALIKRHKKIEFYTEYIYYPRIQGVNKEKYFDAYHNFFDNKYLNQKELFDIIFVTDDPALNYMLEYHDVYFPGTPVVFSGINNHDKDRIYEKNNLFVGVLENVDYKGTLEIAFKLHPKTKRFYIVGDKTNTSQDQIAKIKQLSSQFPIEFIYLDDLSFSKLADTLNYLGKEDLVFLLAFYSDITGSQITPNESIDFINNNTQVPVYTFWKWQLDRGGIFGGKVLSGYEHGQEAVDKFYKQDLKEKFLVEGGNNPYIFDYNQLIKFKIDIKKLPHKAQIINKPFSFYDTYEVLVNSVIIFITILIINSFIMYLNIKKRKQTEYNLKNSKKELSQLNNELDNKIADRTKELEKTVSNLKLTQNKLVESEKMSSLGVLVAGVAHEINTPIGIGLTGATHFLEITNKIRKDYEEDMMSENEFKNYITTSKEIANLINTNLHRTAQLVENFKKISFDQSSEEKRKINLKEYIDEILFSMKIIIKKTNLKVLNKSSTDIEIFTYPGAISQIITNLIINSIKHAFIKNENGNIIINANMENNKIKLVYEDDGKGIDKEILPKIFDPFFTTNRDGGGTGLGLNILYNIVSNSLRGTIKCYSEKSKGAKFIILFKESVNDLK